MAETEQNTSSASPETEVNKEDVLVTKDGQVLEQSILGTVKIDTGEDTKKNSNRLKSAKFAVAGLIYILVREQSIQFATVTTIITVIVGLWLQIGTFSWGLLVLALGSVWITESLNTAIEAAINLASGDDPHPMAKIGKDVASTAALVSSIVFVIIVMLILLPRLLDRLNVG